MYAGSERGVQSILSVCVVLEQGVQIAQALRVVPIFVSSPKFLESDIAMQSSYIYRRYGLGPTTKLPGFKDVMPCRLAV